MLPGQLFPVKSGFFKVKQRDKIETIVLSIVPFTITDTIPYNSAFFIILNWPLSSLKYSGNTDAASGLLTKRADRSLVNPSGLE